MITCEFENKSKASLRHLVVDTILIRDDQIMLIKRAEGMTEGGKWALPGGYVDRDETAAEAAKREVLEETGHDSEGYEFFKFVDDPDRPGDDRQNVPVIFTASALEKKSEPDHETQEARWFALDSLPPKETIAFDHFDLIEQYKNV